MLGAWLHLIIIESTTLTVWASLLSGWNTKQLEFGAAVFAVLHYAIMPFVLNSTHRTLALAKPSKAKFLVREHFFSLQNLASFSNVKRSMSKAFHKGQKVLDLDAARKETFLV